MITIEEIDDMIKGVSGEISGMRISLKSASTLDAKKIERAIKQSMDSLEFYRKMKMYLETNPREQFVRGSLKIWDDRRVSIESTSRYYRENNAPEMAAKIEKDNKLKEIKQKIKNLKFILKEQ